MIKWTKSDAIRLGKAIADFNKAVKALENEINKLYLPELREYKVARETIKSRAELERIIKSMRRFTKFTNSADLVTTESGEVLTRWEMKELKYARAGQLRKVNAELKKANFTEKPYKTERIKELEAEKNRLTNLFTKTGDDFEKAKNRILKKASKDYEFYKFRIYQINYISVLKRYEGFDNYDRLVKYISNLTPQQFYDKSQSISYLSDLTYLSDQYLAQDSFNGFVEMWMG